MSPPSDDRRGPPPSGTILGVPTSQRRAAAPEGRASGKGRPLPDDEAATLRDVMADTLRPNPHDPYSKPPNVVTQARVLAPDQAAGDAAGAALQAGAEQPGPTWSSTSASPMRAYADGILTTVSGQNVDPGDPDIDAAVKLPYSSEDVIGRLDSYDLLSELGRGAMGVVYRGFSLQLCRPCAIKVMLPDDNMSAVDILRFQNEAMLAARLSHAGIVSVFDAGEVEGWFYIVMELVEGGPLTAVIEDPSDEAFERGLRAISKTARALHYAHGQGIVHRDIKPDNILVDPDGNPHITDFGIAKSINADRRMTIKGMLMGTPLYMSPEQANGETAAIGPASDIYSLGVTLYELCTGTAPFVADNIYEILAQVLKAEPPSPRVQARRFRDRDLALDLETICLKAIEKSATQRYPSAAALADDIDAYLEDKPISARPIGRTERLQKLIRRNRGAFVTMAVVFATLLVVSMGFGAVMVSTIQVTSDSLRSQDEKAARDQAETVERSIRVNMLQGRADVVRRLINALRNDPKISYLDVVRTDRTYAYTDLATRNRVARRISDDDIKQRYEDKFPDLATSFADLEDTALPNIEKGRTLSKGLYDYDRAAWNDMLKSLDVVVTNRRVDGEPILTVLKPIENSARCQACHGEEDEAGYGPNNVRAVLVVERSQKAVEDQIAANQRTTILVGSSTIGVILALIWLFARLFGVRLRRRHFGA
ncbi:MAG: hypothetical protein Tsb0020_24530 [Haliangiales bacterium]